MYIPASVVLCSECLEELKSLIWGQSQQHWLADHSVQVGECAGGLFWPLRTDLEFDAVIGSFSISGY